jgi:hypothetical protein
MRAIAPRMLGSPRPVPQPLPDGSARTPLPVLGGVVVLARACSAVLIRTGYGPFTDRHALDASGPLRRSLPHASHTPPTRLPHAHRSNPADWGRREGLRPRSGRRDCDHAPTDACCLAGAAAQALTPPRILEARSAVMALAPLGRLHVFVSAHIVLADQGVVLHQD